MSTAPTHVRPAPSGAGRISAVTRELQRRNHSLIPGGSHTYAKGDDQYPELAPPFIARGRGCRVWDLDHNEYIEYGMGQRSVTLGHAYPSVVKAAQDALAVGTNFNRPSPLEVACAESLVELIDAADMVKFTKDGSTANTGAVKLARAYTGKRVVALCEDHPFFSYDDWAMGVTPVDAGIPDEHTALTDTFRYGDLDSARAVFDRNEGDVACLILEPARGAVDENGFLNDLRDLCHRNGALLILDEQTTAFRWHEKGAQHLFGVQPDLSTFGKALGNGFAISALAGRREIMNLGGLDHEEPRVFLLSTTHGAETHALAACIEVMRIYRDEPVVERLHAAGDRLREGLDQVIARHGVAPAVELSGRSPSLLYATRDPEGNPSQAYRTLLLQELCLRGVIAPSLMVSYSHTDDDIDRTIEAFDGALGVYAGALEVGTEGLLVGPPSASVYRRYNHRR